MNRRLLSPLGAGVLFALLTLLVLGGLTWVTLESLRLETEQRHASARADMAQIERLALWRLDSRLFPAMGVENNRLYAHYFPLHTPLSWVSPQNVAANNDEPALLPSPLLMADLPSWMKLHVQLDPETGWDSPQVMSGEIEAKFHDQLIDLYEATSNNLNGSRSQALADLRQQFPAKLIHEQLLKLEAVNPDDSPLGVPYFFEQPNVKNAATQTSTVGAANGIRGNAKTAEAFAIPALEPQRGVSADKAIEPMPVPMPVPMPTPPAAPPGNSSALSGNRGVQQQASQQVNGPGDIGGYAGRSNAGRVSNGEVISKSESVTPPPAPIMTGGGMPSPVKPPPSEPKSEAKPGDAAMRKSTAKKTDAADHEKSKAAPDAKPQAPMAPKPVASPDTPLADSASKYVKESPPALKQIDDRAKDGKDALTPAGKNDNSFARDNFRKLSNPNLRPPAVHLGPMRPVWITAPTGEQALMLVRAAKLERKVVFQGVLLEWPVLQSVLLDEIRPQLPEAKLEPVKVSAESDRQMTALPAVLDPGPEPTPPPAGATPLRIGLSLGWLAAILALAATGFVGWTLIDLSERRIRFVSAVTHELRTPLTSLRLYLDLLTSGMISDEQQQKEYLQTLNKESDRLNRLIENVLDFAKLEKRSVQAQCTQLPLADLLETVRQSWADHLLGEGRELVVMSLLPPEQTLHTDVRMATQILGNLIDNARKYAAGAEDRRIWLWARPGDGRCLCLEVEDRGPGVPVGERAGIFKPFRRGGAADTTAGGAGLGLALARQWADMLGGTLSYRSAEGGIGACFRLELPLG